MTTKMVMEMDVVVIWISLSYLSICMIDVLGDTS